MLLNLAKSAKARRNGGHEQLPKFKTMGNSPKGLQEARSLDTKDMG